MNEEDVKRIIGQSSRDAQYNVAKVPYHVHNNIDSPSIPFENVSNAPNCFLVATNTSGTSTVPILGRKGPPFNLTITGVFLISKDTTAGNVSVYNSGATVATIAKGTTAGVMVGATSLSHSTYATGHTMNVASSSSGNATVFVSFTT